MMIIAGLISTLEEEEVVKIFSLAKRMRSLTRSNKKQKKII